VDPLASSAGILNQPASGHFSNHLGPRVLRSERVLLSLSSSLLRPDPSVSTAPPAFPRTLVIQEASCPTTWSGLRSRPSLLWVSAPSTRAVTSTPGGEAGPVSPISPCCHGLPHWSNESAPPIPPTPASVGTHLTTLTVFAPATARVIARPPVPVRPGVILRPSRTFTPELSQGTVTHPPSQV
jgi:hypothetical protein